MMLIEYVSGVVGKVLKEGNGNKPTLNSKVVLQYTGWSQKTGQMFDSSLLRQEPSEFVLQDCIPGWQDGLADMNEGETRRLWIPANMAYGDEGYGNVPGGDLTYDITLVKVKNELDPFVVYGVSVATLLFIGNIIVSGLPAPERPEYDTEGPLPKFTPDEVKRAYGRL